MEFKSGLCKVINSMFPVPIHPFNLQNDGKKTYAQWQFEKGKETVKFYLDKVMIEEMFKNKVVLDIGCGAAGKTLYYASQGVKKIYGIDVVAKYEKEANSLAAEKALSEQFKFVYGNAAALQFEDNFFDSIIMNDAMEHIDEPLKVLQECNRVLKPSGRLYVNFPPYYHPFGAHLSDAIGFPWVHIFFEDGTLIKVYKDLIKHLPDYKERVNFRISKDKNGKEYFSYINKMTISKFKKIIQQTSLKNFYYKEIPLRTFLKPLTILPGLKEITVKMVVCIFEKVKIEVPPTKPTNSTLRL